MLVQHTVGESLNDKYPVRLTIKVKLQLPSGPSLDLTALVDTGAEVNIIRPGLVDNIHFRPSKRRLHFVAANQTTLAGGRRELAGALIFDGVDNDTKAHTPVTLPIVCFDADVVVDVLISYA